MLEERKQARRSADKAKEKPEVISTAEGEKGSTLSACSGCNVVPGVCLVHRGRLSNLCVRNFAAEVTSVKFRVTGNATYDASMQCALKMKGLDCADCARRSLILLIAWPCIGS
jgi:hypothetical protein